MQQVSLAAAAAAACDEGYMVFVIRRGEQVSSPGIMHKVHACGSSGLAGKGCVTAFLLWNLRLEIMRG